MQCKILVVDHTQVLEVTTSLEIVKNRMLSYAENASTVAVQLP